MLPTSDNEPLPDPPDRDYLAWVTQHPEEVAAYLRTVKALRKLTLIVTFGGLQKKVPIVFSGENSTIEIKLS